MKKIIAIGGGEIGRPGFSVETTRIDKEILRLSGKKHPQLLFLPTASKDSVSYFATVKKYFGDTLGCNVNVLYLTNSTFSKSQMREIILSSDIIYVGGGNTLEMMRTWRKIGVSDILKEAYEKGVTLSGLSAGAICWFKYGNSDSLRARNKKVSSIRVSGLGLINALFCPHYDVEKYRKLELKEMMKKNNGVAIAIDNCAAIEIVDEAYRILNSKETAKAYRVFWQKNKFINEIIPQKEDFQAISKLLDKKVHLC